MAHHDEPPARGRGDTARGAGTTSSDDAATSPVPGAVITVSDRCASGDAEDSSGPLAVELLAGFAVQCQSARVVPDGIDPVQDAIARAISEGARVVLTTGGTGISPRDLTPEATEPLLVARLDGVADAIRRRGEEHVVTALLSRGLVGITGHGMDSAVVVNAPGSTGGVRDAIAVLGPLVAHLIDQLDGGDHPSR